MKYLPSTFFVLLFSTLFALTACSKSGTHADASQVAAKVNGAEITVHQINQVLERSNGVTKENTDATSKAILEKLITQELVIAKAQDSKLDRTPEFVMALDAARRELLGQAYINQLTGKPAKVSDEDIKHYFNDHPELFSERRIFSIMDIAFAHDDKLTAPLNDLIAKNISGHDIADWLKSQGTAINVNTISRAAEDLSFDILPKVTGLDVGQSVIFADGQSVHVLNLVNYKQEPEGLASATPKIARFLESQRREQLVTAELKKLRDSAKVEYVGEFAPKPASDTMQSTAAQNIAK
jgi:EpsD family peptidyl-prolyl cis-trans isomerase